MLKPNFFIGFLLIVTTSLLLASCAGQSYINSPVIGIQNKSNTNSTTNGALIVDTPVPTDEVRPTDEPTLEPTTGPVDSGSLVEILGNLSYTGIFPDKPIKLTDGYYDYSEGGVGTPHVSLVERLILTGDLNADEAQDAIFMLEDDSEGSGRLTFLVAVLDVFTDPKPVEAVILGGRSGVKSLAVDGSQVVADIVTQGPGDADCCASWNVHLVYSLEDGKLEEISRTETNRISLADLNSTKWHLNNLTSSQEAPLPEGGVTIQFKDGQISGFSGCNNYTAPVSIGENGINSLKIGPIMTSKKSCPDSVTNLEKSYLDALAKTISWTYEYGNLGLVYSLDNGQEDVLLFEPEN